MKTMVEVPTPPKKSKKRSVVQHSSATPEWGTPIEIIEAARNVLGRIDLDPASSEAWNARVGAARWIGKDTPWDEQDWASSLEPVSVFLNPPGGKVGNASQTVLFWQRLMRERTLRRVSHAIFLAFSMEALSTTQRRGHLSMLDFPICVPSKRLRFVAQGEAKTSPSHANAIAYVPGSIDRTDEFVAEFSEFGKVKI